MKQSIDALINGILKHENHLSYSSISAFKKSPLDFIKYKFYKSEPTPAMEFGSMVHKLLLEQNKQLIEENTKLKKQSQNTLCITNENSNNTNLTNSNNKSPGPYFR